MILRAALFLLTAFFAENPYPTLESVTGVNVGSARSLVTEAGIREYFHALDDASDRVAVREIGTTTEGRPFMVAFISSESNLARLDRLREIQTRLADPRRLDAKNEESLVAEGRAVVVVAASIHSDEVGGAQAALRIADCLARGATPREREILDQVVTIVIPVQNPDGYAAVADWYLARVGSPFERSPLPVLYHRYAGHDINRDWFRLALQETRLSVDAVLRPWHPEAIIDLHQMSKNGPRFFLPPFCDPVDPEIDPLLQDMGASCGAAVARELDEAGFAGVVTDSIFDAWSPSRSYAAYHNCVRFLFEAAGTDYASSVTLDRNALTFAAQTSSNRQPRPWTGGDWGLEDVVRYHEQSTLSTLGQIAEHREEWLRGFVRVGRRAVSPSGPPYAFAFPREQHDPGALRDLLTILREGEIEIEEVTEPFSVGDRRFDVGTEVVRTAQPFGAFARTLLQRKLYPRVCDPDGTFCRPYDTTGHELPALMGVSCVPVETPFTVKTRAFVPATASATTASNEIGSFLLPAERNDSIVVVNRLLAAGLEIARSPGSVDLGNRKFAPGAWIVHGGREIVEKVARDAGAETHELAASICSSRVAAPRIGLYRSFIATTDFGWTQLVLEQNGFSFDVLTNADFHAPDPAEPTNELSSRFDVIVLPDQSPQAMADGYGDGTLPSEFCGGLDVDGARTLREFAERGGTVVALGRASSYAIRALDLPVRNVIASLDESHFDAPGSILRVLVDVDSPVGWGMPSESFAMVDGNFAFEAPVGRPCVRYPSSGEILRSGWLVGERRIAGRAAVLDVPVGQGRVVLFGIRPQFRAQASGTYKLFFNSLYRAPSAADPATKLTPTPAADRSPSCGKSVNAAGH
ncbi:MAG: hypothetical protein HYR85_03890 [Planctomycetes bacterium]|nr:hypothetical protein [Planctomycetota bacterium]MBI3844818.1 hypothetical protein [Planctomycetota bacterium]